MQKEAPKRYLKILGRKLSKYGKGGKLYMEDYYFTNREKQTNVYYYKINREKTENYKYPFIKFDRDTRKYYA